MTLFVRRPASLGRASTNESVIAVPSILEVDPATFDTKAAIQKYGYSFDDSEVVPKRRALLVLVTLICRRRIHCHYNRWESKETPSKDLTTMWMI